MPSPVEQYSEAVKTSQEAVVKAMESWSDSIKSAFGQSDAAPATMADPSAVIDQVFDFAEKMLQMQREFAKNLASSAASAGETLKQQGEAAMESMKQSTAP